MTLTEAFNDLLNNWKELPKEFRDKYRSYRSKYNKSLKDAKAEKIGEGIMREMLLKAGYSEVWKVFKKKSKNN